MLSRCFIINVSKPSLDVIMLYNNIAICFVGTCILQCGLLIFQFFSVTWQSVSLIWRYEDGWYPHPTPPLKNDDTWYKHDNSLYDTDAVIITFGTQKSSASAVTVHFINTVRHSSKNNMPPFLYCVKFLHHLNAMGEFKLELQSESINSDQN